MRLLILPPNGARRHAHAPRTAVCEGAASRHRSRRDEGERGAQQHWRSPHRVCLIEAVTRPAASCNVVALLLSVRATPNTHMSSVCDSAWRQVCQPEADSASRGG